MGEVASSRCTPASVECTKPAALLGDSPIRLARTANGAGDIRTFVVGPQRIARAGHFVSGSIGHRRDAEQRLATAAPSAVAIVQGPEILRQRTVDLLGPRPPHRATRIMVTLPSEAATDADLFTNSSGAG
jgi:hypothetical protein